MAIAALCFCSIEALSDDSVEICHRSRGVRSKRSLDHFRAIGGAFLCLTAAASALLRMRFPSPAGADTSAPGGPRPFTRGLSVGLRGRSNFMVGAAAHIRRPECARGRLRTLFHFLEFGAVPNLESVTALQARAFPNKGPIRRSRRIRRRPIGRRPLRTAVLEILRPLALCRSGSANRRLFGDRIDPNRCSQFHLAVAIVDHRRAVAAG
jgi:hypothetical protein